MNFLSGSTMAAGDKRKKDSEGHLVADKSSMKIGDLHFRLGLGIRNGYVYPNRKDMWGMYRAGYEPVNISTIVLHVVWKKLRKSVGTSIPACIVKINDT